ncbi:YveK family protein [Floccifex sp.]|uniref:YveK family protein n=1 Tax=Floccifex sp. TaxID=2815810 RepID=UPI003EFFFB4E
MENKQFKDDEFEIDLLELLGVVWKKVPIIVLMTILFGALVMLYDVAFVTPMYESVTKITVLEKQNDKLTSSDLQASTLLTKDYIELVKTRDVTESVINQLGLMSGDEVMTHEQLLNKMTVESVSDTRMIVIRIEDEDPYMACEIANAVREQATIHIQNVLATQAVNVAEVGNIPVEPISPNVKKDGVLGGLVGAVLTVMVVVIKFLMNDSINTSEDVERYLGINTIGLIPINEKIKKKQPKALKQKKVRRHR